MHGQEIVSQICQKLAQSTKTKFDAHRKVLSYWDYLEDVLNRPKVHLRNSACYFTDVVNHFGSYEVQSPVGSFKRYRLFDADFDQGEGRVMGHEKVQESLVRFLHNFVRAGKVDRLVLLHGPNGSAKTSLIQALTRAAEIYSETPEGALYRFNWVFPLKKVAQGALGFSGKASSDRGSYAYLQSDEIEARLPCEHKDHPLLLLELPEREALIHQIVENKSIDGDFSLPDILRRGHLSPKNKKIFDALLTAYRGDVEEVLRHVQVERFYLSRRYRTGFAAVEPQMSVDAYAKQVTVDQSLASLPASLRHLSLFETGGALTDANRGLIEYSDLLKRPLESWKYLLVACEQAQASMDVVSIFIDLVMVASSNELHLASFREYPDWQSFKGRFELVRVPYLLRFSDEVKIYQNQIPRALVGVHIAPHALEIAAKWAVLTRLEPPRPEKYDDNVRDLIRTLSPHEKLEFYDQGKAPERLSQKEARELKRVLPKLWAEYDNDNDYEGRFGASAREMRMLLLNAAQDKRFDHLSPIAVLDCIRSLIDERSSYDFLRREPVRGYHDAIVFVDVVKNHFLKQLDEEMRGALGLVHADSHRQLFERYLKHVSAWTKKERVANPMTNKPENPDVDLMTQVEKALLAPGEMPEEFRKSLISQIAAFRLEQPDQAMDFSTLFAHHLNRLKDEYYQKQRSVVDHIMQQFLRLMDGNAEQISDKEKQQIAVMQENLSGMGYNSSSARQAVAFLQNARNN